MKTANAPKKNGYTLAEVLMASALLGVMVGGAVQLVSTMNIVETAASNNAVAMDMAECGARLWQLGLSGTEVQSVLPITTNNDVLTRSVVADNSGNTVTFGTQGTTALANSMGTLENITLTAITSNPQNSSNLTTTVTAYRPTKR